MELGPRHYVQRDIDGPQVAIQGFRAVRFQLDLREVLEIHVVLFDPRMRVRKILVPSFEDEGYGMMVRSGHIFLHQRNEPFGTTTCYMF